jgi:hypothetical protein
VSAGGNVPASLSGAEISESKEFFEDVFNALSDNDLRREKPRFSGTSL